MPDDTPLDSTHETPRPARPDLDTLMARARKAFDALPPEAQEAIWAEQRKSWARGNLAIDRGPDARRTVSGQAPLDAAEPDGWRPIETANPTDIEDTFDVWQVFTCDGKKTNARRVADAFHDGAAWCDPDGDPLEWKDELGQVARVTHWRPLPPPPAASQEGEG